MATSDQDAAEAALRQARAAWEGGDAALAEARCRDALRAADDARAWTLLGIVLRRRDPNAAEVALRSALERASRDPDAWFHLGNLLREQARYPEAIEAYESALGVSDNPALHNNLGLALEAAHRFERAERAYRDALAYAPGHRQALGNLAHLLCRLQRYREADALCAEYLSRFPDADAVVWIDRGICRHQEGDYDAAIASFQRALSLAPDDALILSNLGSVLADRRDFEGAQRSLSLALEHDPSQLYAASLLAYCEAQLCRWDGLAARHEAIRREIEAGNDQPINAFAALALPLTAAQQLTVARRWARDLEPAAKRVSTPARRNDRVLRLGYVSSDFRVHATASLLAEVWERHDRTRLSTHAYSIGPREDSPLRRRIEAAFDRFVDCHDDSSEETARRIVADGIDILIDLNGYTTRARSAIFALKPAPLQVAWLGYLGTLGAPWYDYVLTDRFACPPEQQRFFTERFLYLPECYCPSDTRREIAAPKSRAQYGLPERGLVFCCFNSPHKILPPIFDIWMRLLRAIPESVLWLAPDNPLAERNLRREAEARGVRGHRLVAAPSVPLAEHLARHVRADLFLDTSPCNGGTTVNDALFVGVPLLTLSGETMANRVAASQLHAIGLPELATADIAAYEALALALALDPARLSTVRERLRANRSTHPLFDMARFAAALDDRLCAAWENQLGIEHFGRSSE